MRKLLVATHNQGKVTEYRHLLADLPISVTYLDELGVTEEVEETEPTFEGNAILKAQTYARLTGLWTWADDSGLEVDALNGRPGVLSSRYAGPSATDEDRWRKLLTELETVPENSRQARFRCVVAIALPDGRVFTSEGEVDGQIIDEPRGDYGFGYDPVFLIPEWGKTMAELPPEVKNRISHRARAAVAAKEILSRLLSELNEE
jgi:XTP/dITP diphosphohydrolase